MWGPTTLGGLLACLGTLLLLQPGAADVRVAGLVHPIRVLVGQDVVLPCRLSPPTDARTFDIRCIRQSFTKMVHHYRNGRDLAEEQLEAYAGRTKLLREGLAGGSLELRIRWVRPSDDGEYVCTMDNGAADREAKVKLEVAASLFHDAHPWMVALSVVLVLLVILVPIVAFLVWKKKSQARELESLTRELEERDVALAWRKFLLPKNQDVVTLDLDTAHSELMILADERTLIQMKTSHNLPETPQRFTGRSCALAREGFGSGRHCWEVVVEGLVGGDSWRAIGVALENIDRKSLIHFSPEVGVWDTTMGSLEL